MQQTELIKVTQNEQGEIAVSGRELHEFLEVNTPYDKWMPRMIAYGFSLEEDFTTFLSESTGGRPATDHVMTLDMAKEVAMIQRTSKGKQARQYFIAVEKEYKKQQLDTESLSPELQLFNQMFLTLAQNEIAVKQLEAKVDSITHTVTVNIRNDWRKQTHQLVNAVAGKYGNNKFGLAKSDIFREVEARAGVNLQTRLSNMKKRSREAGQTVVNVQKLNAVDVIAADKKLIEIYITVVKEFAIRYNVYQNQLEQTGGAAA